MSFEVKNYSFSLGQHKGQQVIWIHFPKEQMLIDDAKKLVGIRWSASQKCWYVLDRDDYRQQFLLLRCSVCSVGHPEPLIKRICNPHTRN